MLTDAYPRIAKIKKKWPQEMEIDFLYSAEMKEIVPGIKCPFFPGAPWPRLWVHPKLPLLRSLLLWRRKVLGTRAGIEGGALKSWVWATSGPKPAISDKGRLF